MENQSQPQEMAGLHPGFFQQFKNFLIKEKAIIIVILLLSLISFGISGYILKSDKKTPVLRKSLPQANLIPASSATPLPSPKNSISPTITPTPALIVSETATWSAFASTKYSYSVKYPPNWTAQLVSQADPKILEYVVFNPTATKAGTLSITLSYGTRTYLEALALDPQVGESIKIASASATKKNSKDSNGNKAVNIIVPAGVNSIVLNAKDAFASLFNQMLTTLKLPK